jgi:hypothetical protein
MTASTTTTIHGVSIFSRRRKRKSDVFDITLSPEGIVIWRPGRAEEHMTWERISQWEIEERHDCLVLTLRGGGSVTPLMVKGWKLEDLRTVMREATAGPTGPATGPVTPVTPDAGERLSAPVEPAAASHQASGRARRGIWKPLVTVLLLGVLVTAVVVVLLQSAGAISWSFLGPVA